MPSYVPTSFVGMYAPRWSSPAKGRLHRDKRRRDVGATQFSSAFAGRRPMGTDPEDPEVWSLRCPEGTGRSKRCNLTEPRLRPVTDVQAQGLCQHTCLYGPSRLAQAPFYLRSLGVLCQANSR